MVKSAEWELVAKCLYNFTCCYRYQLIVFIRNQTTNPQAAGSNPAWRATELIKSGKVTNPRLLYFHDTVRI